jgi:hypothetical protein
LRTSVLHRGKVPAILHVGVLVTEQRAIATAGA